MFIENFDKIYGENLHTMATIYSIERDTMTIAPHHHVLRLIPKVGKSNVEKTVVLMKTDSGVKIGIYTDSAWNPILIKEQKFKDIKRLGDFKILLAELINPYE
jgi:hypothetical protein